MYRIYRVAEYNGSNIPQAQMDFPKDEIAMSYFRDWVNTSEPGKYIMEKNGTTLITEIK